MLSAGQIRDRARLLSHEMRLAERVAQARPDLALPNAVLLTGPDFLTVDQLFVAPVVITDGFTVPGQPLPLLNLPRAPLFQNYSPMEAPSALRDEVLDETPLDQLMSLPTADDILPVVDPSLIDISQPWGDAANSTQAEPMVAAWAWLEKLFTVFSPLPSSLISPIPEQEDVADEAPSTPASAAQASSGLTRKQLQEQQLQEQQLHERQLHEHLAQALAEANGSRQGAAQIYAPGSLFYNARWVSVQIQRATPSSPLWKYRVAHPDVETPEGALDLVLELAEKFSGQELRDWVAENGYTDLGAMMAKFRAVRNKYTGDDYYHKAPNPNLLFKRLAELRTALPQLLSGEVPAGELRGLISDILASPDVRALPQPLYQWLRSVDTGTNSSHGVAVDDGAYLDELADLLAK